MVLSVSGEWPVCLLSNPQLALSMRHATLQSCLAVCMCSGLHFQRLLYHGIGFVGRRLVTLTTLHSCVWQPDSACSQVNVDNSRVSRLE